MLGFRGLGDSDLNRGSRVWDFNQLVVCCSWGAGSGVLKGVAFSSNALGKGRSEICGCGDLRIWGAARGLADQRMKMILHLGFRV
jgi:hypothetical protein